MEFSRRSLFGPFVVALLILLGSLVATAAWAQQPNRVPVLIGFRHQPGAAEQALVRRAGGSIKYTYHLVPAIAATLPENAVDALRRNPNVTIIEPDGLFYKIDYATELNNTWGVKRIGSGNVHANGNKGTNVRVAIIDSGIDYTHPDLNTNYVGGYDFVNKDAYPMDDNGHGTHVAGTVAALMNGTGVVGVAPEAKLYGLKVLDARGSGSFSNVIAALQWAVDNGIQVTNNSYGSSGDPGSLVKAAFDNSYAAGVLHIAAAGNSGSCNGKSDTVGYPAKYTSVVAVAATNKSDARPCWSSTGPAVEVSAPGATIRSTRMGGGYVEYSGTSMASPHVAGVAALVVAAGVLDENGNGRINDEVRGILTTTAIDLGSTGRDPHYGFGLVDAVGAVGAVSIPSAPAPPAPGVYVNLSTDKATYDSGADVAVLTAVVKDESNQPIGGLAASAFSTTLNNGSVAVQFSESGTAGTYTGSLNISTLLDGSYTAEVTVTASDVFGSGSATFTITPISTVNTVSVTEITYATSGGRTNDRHLSIALQVNNDLGEVVGGASLSIDVYRNNALLGSASGTTGSNGKVSFTYNNAPSGCYSTTVTTVSAVGLSWDNNTPDNKFCK